MKVWENFHLCQFYEIKNDILISNLIIFITILLTMNSDTKKKVIIGISIAAAILAGIFIKNKLQESRFKPLSKDTVVQIIKKARKENFNILKQVSMISNQIATQMKISQMQPQMVKNYLDSPESPIKVSEAFEKNYTQACESLGAKYSDFNASLEYYIKNGDKQIQHLIEQFERDYEVSLGGRLPQLKVNIPPSLTKERLIQIQKKLTLKKYLLQIDVFRKIRGKTQQELMSNPQILKTLSNPDEEEQKILEDEGLGTNEEPAAAVFAAAISQYRNDTGFKETFNKIDLHYGKIFHKYRSKIQQNKMTENQLNQLEDELIYTQAP